MVKSRLVSIIIPTYNEEKNIGNLIQSIFDQGLNIYGDGISIEIIIIDSGSKDRTLEIISFLSKKYTYIRLYKVSRFHHAVIRNLGARLSRGDVIVFLNADAKPLNKSWLGKLIGPILEGRVEATFSRHIPPKGLFNTEALLIITGFPKKNIVLGKNNYLKFYKATGMIYSSVSCAVRRDVFFRIGGFNKYVPIDEDQDFGLRLIKSGYKIMYVADSIVVHAHNLSFKSAVVRYYRFAKGWKAVYSIHKELRNVSLWGLFGKVLKNMKSWLFRAKVSKVKRIHMFLEAFLIFVSSLLGFIV